MGGGGRERDPGTEEYLMDEGLGLSITSLVLGPQRATLFPQPEQGQGLVFW